MPATHPQAFASVVPQTICIEHISPGLRRSAFAAATHARAWQGTAGAQSASVVHASSLGRGSQRKQPQRRGDGEASVEGGVDVGEVEVGAGEIGAGEIGAGEVEVDGVGTAIGAGGGAAPAQATIGATATHEKAQNRIASLYLDRHRVHAHPFRMAEGDDKKTPPDPVDDLKKGFGLLFRAAKSAVDQLPTEKLEQVVVNGVKEVGRAIENVTDQIDRQIFHGKGTIPHPEDKAPPPPAAATPPDPTAAAATAPPTGTDAVKKDAATPPPDDAPKGPRVV